MVVVDAVDDEVEAIAAAELRLPVEEQAVEPVFGQRPDADPDREHEDGGPDREPSVDSEPQSPDHHGHEDDRRDGRVDAG
jgi:hypothetical protein